MDDAKVTHLSQINPFTKSGISEKTEEKTTIIRSQILPTNMPGDEETEKLIQSAINNTRPQTYVDEVIKQNKDTGLYSNIMETSGISTSSAPLSVMHTWELEDNYMVQLFNITTQIIEKRKNESYSIDDNLIAINTLLMSLYNQNNVKKG